MACKKSGGDGGGQWPWLTHAKGMEPKLWIDPPQCNCCHDCVFEKLMSTGGALWPTLGRKRERERFCEFMWARYGPVSTNLWGAMEVNPRDSRLHICVCERERDKHYLSNRHQTLFPYADCRVGKRHCFWGSVGFFILFATTFSYFGDFCTFAIPEESDSKIQELE